jgi:membrane-bound lytic murein transglycosylase D
VNREIYLFFIAIAASLQVSLAQTQADSLETPLLIEINAAPFSWETQWEIWCDSQDCVSSDTSLWNIVGEPHLELDTVVMKSRMAILDMSSELDLSWNPISHTRVALYVDRRKIGLGTMLGRAPAFFPLFEEVLDKKGLPLNLKYLPIVESALNPEARSHAGARGLWQFMYYTAKAEGLRIDSYIDERKDPRKSTEAACNHLNRLYRVYDDWFLALAAYNAGSGNVNKAIRRSGGKTNYWEVRSFLPKETRNYVPNFLAVVYLMEYHAEYGIVPRNVIPGFLTTDTINIQGPLRLDQIAQFLDASEEELKILNPIYSRNIIPGPGENWTVRIPLEMTAEFIAHESEMRGFKPELTPEIKYEPDPIFYRVKSGDVLGTIAQKHGVSVGKLKAWNGLKNSNINVGQRLVIHGDPSKI